MAIVKKGWSVSCDTFVVMSDATVSGEVSLTITSLIPR